MYWFCYTTYNLKLLIKDTLSESDNPLSSYFFNTVFERNSFQVLLFRHDKIIYEALQETSKRTKSQDYFVKNIFPRSRILYYFLLVSIIVSDQTFEW